MMDERMLVQAARQGDLEAFNQLVLLHQDRIYRHSAWLLGNTEDAEDVSQTAFLQAYQHIDSFGEGSFLAWLLRIATNAAYDELRRRKRKPVISLEDTFPGEEERDLDAWLADPGASIEELVDRAEVSAFLQRALAELPDEHRAVIILADLFEYDYQAAAAILGIPVGTVKSRLARARLGLRQVLLRLSDISFGKKKRLPVPLQPARPRPGRSERNLPAACQVV